ncbi:hypothetical protein [Psychrobacter lutiphocae]|nr:hypothetical protein [Psychrobacter lutiphocae]
MLHSIPSQVTQMLERTKPIITAPVGGQSRSGWLDWLQYFNAFMYK